MLLVINTAFLTANLALKTNDKTILKDLDAKSKHSENVLKTIDSMCQEANIDILDVDSVAVVVGPGSFTGLRIGVAIAKALGCVKKQLNFISLSSLQFMAYIIAKKRLCNSNFACIINALSGKYFICKFDKNGNPVDEETMVEEDFVKSLNIPIFALLGDVKNFHVNEISLNCIDLLDFASIKDNQHEYVNIDVLLPKYIRPSQAEDSLLKKSKKM